MDLKSPHWFHLDALGARGDLLQALARIDTDIEVGRYAGDERLILEAWRDDITRIVKRMNMHLDLDPSDMRP